MPPASSASRRVDGAAAARAAGFGLLALAALPLIAALVTVVSAPQVGIGGLVGVLGAGVALAMGGSVEVTASLGGVGGGASLAVMPLTATLAGTVALGASWAKGLPRAAYPTPAVVAGIVRQGLLTLGLFVGGVLVVALGGCAALDGALIGGPVGLITGARVSVGAGGTAVGALLLGAAALVVALAWARPEFLPPRVRAVRDLAAGPAVAVRVTLLLAAVATVLGVIVALVVSSAASATPPSVAAVALAAAWFVLSWPNTVVTALGFGSGAPLVTDLPGLPGTILGAGGVPTSFGLADAAASSVAVWLLPCVIAVCLVAGATRMALAAPDRHIALARSWRLGLAWAAVLLLGSLLSAVHLSITGSTPLLGRAGVDVHLSYGLVLIAGFGWGVVAGPLGALLARALPDDVVDGFRGLLPGRRVGVTTAAVGLVCVLSVSAAWAATGLPRTTPTIPQATPPTYAAPSTRPDTPAYLPYPSPYPTPTAPSSAPTSSSTVALNSAAASDPDAASVQNVLGRYFSAINAGDYDAWSAVVTPAIARDQPRADWQRGYRTTRDDQVAVLGIAHASPGKDLVTVSFRSTQDPADAPRDLRVPRICWRMTYPVDVTNVRIGQASTSSIVRQAC